MSSTSRTEFKANFSQDTQLSPPCRLKMIGTVTLSTNTISSAFNELRSGERSQRFNRFSMYRSFSQQ